MLNKKALAGTPSTPPAFVEDVFSTFLYTGNGSSQSIANSVDLATKGGMVWIKDRGATYTHYVADTVGGTSNYLRTPLSSGYETSVTTRITSFDSSGFDVLISNKFGNVV